MTKNNYTIQQIKDFRAKNRIYINLQADKLEKEKYYAGLAWKPGTTSEVLEEFILIDKVLDSWLKCNSILEEAINEIAMYPEFDARQTAKGMRGIAITAMDEMREIYYERKINTKPKKKTSPVSDNAIDYNSNYCS